MHHGPITCACLAAPFLNGYCAGSLKGHWCGQRNTAVHSCSNTVSKHGGGVICLNPSAKRLPDTAAAMLDGLWQTSKTNQELKSFKFVVWCAHSRSGIRQKGEMLRESKTNRTASVTADVAWWAESKNSHTPQDFALEMRHIFVWCHLWHRVTQHQLFNKLLRADLHFWLRESQAKGVFVIS